MRKARRNIEKGHEKYCGRVLGILRKERRDIEEGWEEYWVRGY